MDSISGTKEEYLELVRNNPWEFPCRDWQTVPREWIAEAWDMEEIQDSIVSGGLVRDVGKGLGLSCAEFLAMLAAVLSPDQVLQLFLNIRDSNPHREAEFRPAFEQAFARDAAGLPPPLTRDEVISALGMDEATAHSFLDGGTPADGTGKTLPGEDNIPF